MLNKFINNKSLWKKQTKFEYGYSCKKWDTSLKILQLS